MNITKAIGKEISNAVHELLKKTPEIQVYANDSINRYQWRDNRFSDTSDQWENIDFASRGEMKRALVKHLELRGDI